MTDVMTLANMAALRAYAGGSAAPAIWIEGYSLPGDGGEGMFTYVPSDTTSPDNGGTIILDAAGDRYYREQHLGPLNILWFGGSGNGSSDNTAALTSALAALPDEGGEIYFPSGRYLFGSPVSFSFPAGDKPFSVLFRGAARDATTLYWPSTDGISLALSDVSHTVHFRDMSFSSAANGTCTAITVNQSAGLGVPAFGSDFTNLAFLGHPVGADWAGCWGFAIAITGLSFVNYAGVLVNGVNSAGGGIVIQGNPATQQYVIQHNLTSCFFISVVIGVIYGDFVQGVTIAQCNFVGQANSVGVRVVSGAVGSLAQLTISDSQFGVVDSNQIVIESALGGLSLTGNLFFVWENLAGLVVGPSADLNNAVITGNSFSGLSKTKTVGIDCSAQSASNGNIVTGNNFYQLAVGVLLGESSYNWNVQANVYSDVAVHVVDKGKGNSIGVATD